MFNLGSGFIVVINYAIPIQGPTPGADDLLTEAGGFILTEDNQRLETES